MSFHASSSDIRVDDGHILRAKVRREDGSESDTEINLNDFIGNNNGASLPPHVTAPFCSSAAKWPALPRCCVFSSRPSSTQPANHLAGTFEWGSQNFSESAQNIRFSVEGGDNVPVLRAELRDADGNWHERDVNLGERIGNDNGNLVYN
ncbi:Cyanovirin-N [Thozetella sp. PMI_491]|nr:Cyanovirin-N [Thozetella sp. PMI_491]